MREGGLAAGFVCPICSHDIADVLELEPPLYIRLRCRFCEEVWTEDLGGL